MWWLYGDKAPMLVAPPDPGRQAQMNNCNEIDDVLAVIKGGQGLRRDNTSGIKGVFFVSGSLKGKGKGTDTGNGREGYWGASNGGGPNNIRVNGFGSKTEGTRYIRPVFTVCS